MQPDATLSEWIAQSRIAQGLPPILTDPVIADRAAEVFRAVARSSPARDDLHARRSDAA